MPGEGLEPAYRQAGPQALVDLSIFFSRKRYNFSLSDPVFNFFSLSLASHLVEKVSV